MTIYIIYVLIYYISVKYIQAKMAVDILQHIVESIIHDPLTQLTWFMWMIIILIGYFQKDDRDVKKFMLISAVFWWAHFYMLWVYSGLAAIVIWVVRILLSLKYKKNRKAFMSIFVGTIIIGYFTYDGFMSMLPILCSLTWAYSYFYLEKIKLRCAMLFNSWIYLVYNFFVWSISWVINEWLVQVVLIFTIYRTFHPESGTKYYLSKITEILRNRKDSPDYDRFIFVRDKVLKYRRILEKRANSFIHFDLKHLIKRKHSFFKKHKSLLKKSIDILNTPLFQR